VDAETFQRMDFELLDEPLFGASSVELPGVEHAHREGELALQDFNPRMRFVAGQQDFPRGYPKQFLTESLFRIQLHHPEVSGRNVEIGEPESFATIGPRNGGQVIGLIGEEVLAFQDQTRRDHPGHLAANKTLGLPGIFHLVADGHLPAGSHQLGDIALGGMVGHPAHGNRVFRLLVARGERDFEDAGGSDRILQEQLVEIPHAIEQQGVRIPCLDFQVLLHHGGPSRSMRP